MVEHFCVKFGDPTAAAVFETLFGNKKTDKQTNATENQQTGRKVVQLFVSSEFIVIRPGRHFSTC